MYSHLTHAERCQIYALNKRGISQRSIARDLGRCVSTISQELKRNRGLRGYRHEQAQKLSVIRQREANTHRTKMAGKLLIYARRYSK